MSRVGRHRPVCEAGGKEAVRASLAPPPFLAPSSPPFVSRIGVGGRESTPPRRSPSFVPEVPARAVGSHSPWGKVGAARGGGPSERRKIFLPPVPPPSGPGRAVRPSAWLGRPGRVISPAEARPARSATANGAFGTRDQDSNPHKGCGRTGVLRKEGSRESRPERARPVSFPWVRSGPA